VDALGYISIRKKHLNSPLNAMYFVILTILHSQHIQSNRSISININVIVWNVLVKVLRDTISKLLCENHTEHVKNINVLKKQKSKKENKLKTCKLHFGMGMINKEIDSYRTFTEKAGLAVIRKITESYKTEKEENPCGNSSLVNSCA